MKSPDLLGAYACSACHDVYDRRNMQNILSREKVELYFWQGHARSLCILIAKKLIVQTRGVLEIA